MEAEYVFWLKCANVIMALMFLRWWRKGFIIMTVTYSTAKLIRFAGYDNLDVSDALKLTFIFGGLDSLLLLLLEDYFDRSGTELNISRRWWRNSSSNRAAKNIFVDDPRILSRTLQPSTESVQELLPTIPDDVTLTHIATKLPWTTLHRLSSVSLSWKKAIGSGLVYNARVRSRSTETLVAIVHCKDSADGMTSISLYSMREKAFYQLPPIPHLPRGISRFSQFISFDGKLHVFGADCPTETCRCNRAACTKCHPIVEDFSKKENQMYMLDLASQGQWKKSPVMSRPGSEKAIGRLGTYIVVKEDCGLPPRGDPIHMRCPEMYEGVWNDWQVDGYWRRMDRFSRLFRAGGKTFWMTTRGNRHEIAAFDLDKYSWVQKHIISCKELGHGLGPSVAPVKVHLVFLMPVNNELLAKALLKSGNSVQGICFLQTKGFGTDRKRLEWEKVPQPSFDVANCYPMCPIQL